MLPYHVVITYITLIHFLIVENELVEYIHRRLKAAYGDDTRMKKTLLLASKPDMAIRTKEASSLFFSRHYATAVKYDTVHCTKDMICHE
jgi:hypothetical protein